MLVDCWWQLVTYYALLVLDSAENPCFFPHKTWPRWSEPYLWSQFWRVTKRNGLCFEAGSDT
jgi:hypothetical protein